MPDNKANEKQWTIALSKYHKLRMEIRMMELLTTNNNHVKQKSKDELHIPRRLTLISSE